MDPPLNRDSNYQAHHLRRASGECWRTLFQYKPLKVLAWGDPGWEAEGGQDIHDPGDTQMHDCDQKSAVVSFTNVEKTNRRGRNLVVLVPTEVDQVQYFDPAEIPQVCHDVDNPLRM